MCDNPIWKLRSGDWIQGDSKMQFEILDPKTGKVKENQSGLDVILGAKWHSPSGFSCGGFFPPEFSYCSFCGKNLVKGAYESAPWIPPFGNGSGLRLASERINATSILTKKQKNNLAWIDGDEDFFLLPRPRGDYEFIVAPLGTHSPVLIAFDRRTGLSDYYSPAGANGGRWIHLPPVPGCRVSENILPNWSWAAAVISGTAGFAVPTCEGPVWLFIDWQNSKCIPKSGKGECLGGAAVIENQVFIPTLTEEGVVLQSFDFPSSQWKQVGTPVQNSILEPGEGRYFSVPIIDAGRRVLYWMGFPGLLAFDLTNHSCSWRPWETDAHPCRAVLELGPPYLDSTGNYWQICYDDYDESQQERAFRYYKLNGNESDREDVDGGRFSSGISCFSINYDFWEKPWVKVDKRQERAKTIRVPMLCLDEESKATITVSFRKGENEVSILEMLKTRGRKYQTELRIESPQDSPIELLMPHSFSISSPWDLRVFLFQYHLYVYSTDEAVCHKWRLK